MAIDVEQQLALLKARMEERPGAKKKLSMIVFSGNLDKHIASTIIATGAAAMGMKVEFLLHLVARTLVKQV